MSSHHLHPSHPMNTLTTWNVLTWHFHLLLQPHLHRRHPSTMNFPNGLCLSPARSKVLAVLRRLLTLATNLNPDTRTLIANNLIRLISMATLSHSMTMRSNFTHTHPLLTPSWPHIEDTTTYLTLDLNLYFLKDYDDMDYDRWTSFSSIQRIS